jgi:hypothetical protein
MKCQGTKYPNIIYYLNKYLLTDLAHGYVLATLTIMC